MGQGEGGEGKKERGGGGVMRGGARRREGVGEGEWERRKERGQREGGLEFMYMYNN